MPVTRTITLTIDETRVKPEHMVDQAVELLNALLWGVTVEKDIIVDVRVAPFKTRGRKE